MNTKRILVGLIALTITVLALGGCAPAPTLPTAVPPAAAPTGVPTQAPTAVLTATALPATATPAAITVTDSANRTLTLAAPPQRIVSLAPSTTEIAFALGLDNRVVAVDNWSDYPAETKDLPKLKMLPMNLEQVVAFKPDLVLAAGITNADDVKKMADLKLTVLVVGASTMSFDSIYSDILLVGKATGTEAKAKTITDAMKQKVDALKANLAKAQTKPRVYWEIDATDPAKPYTPGPGSFINDLIALAGGVNIAANAKSAWAQINAEEIVAANPDLIILSDTAYGITVESAKARKGWSAISAVKNAQVFPIDENLVSRPGPRIADGLEATAKLIHPELFK